MELSAKRAEKEIIQDIAEIYSHLSPENLFCDGEAPTSYIRNRKRRLTNALDCLFRELGREISETEAYEFVRS